MYSCGPPHMDAQEWDDQHELTYSNYVRTQDVTLKTCRRRWMIGRNGERGSGISALAARHDDDDDDDKFNLTQCLQHSINSTLGHMYLHNTSKQAACDTRLIFLVKFNRFELRDFFLLDQLPYQDYRIQSALQFTYSWWENSWIHTFSKGIWTMGNVNSLVQGLNSGHHVHFLFPLHHEHLKTESYFICQIFIT